MAKRWIKSAVKPANKGKFSAAAAAAGESTHAYAEEKKDAPGTLGKEARLALTFEKMRHKRKGTVSKALYGKD